ncbi:hypothetical protein CHELA1G11_11625 [Hyphomicrobiales bacterium]|nr:hypothetical protein CHELA1G11_11625 [Hyphomicrobiales bacterium]CAH1666449.1 hypothetical protein CHELA1G2_12683 [Hyphomicrobiales bacterium]
MMDAPCGYSFGGLVRTYSWGVSLISAIWGTGLASAARGALGASLVHGVWHVQPAAGMFPAAEPERAKWTERQKPSSSRQWVMCFHQPASSS